jgi:hypothetical protein
MSGSGVAVAPLLPESRRTRQAMAGAGAGALTKTSVAPLERVKILFQIQGMQAQAGERAKYRGLVQALRLIVREEGGLALWRGNGANCVRVVPVYALKFTFNDAFKDMVRSGQPGASGDLSVAQRMMAGTMAGLCQTTITYPLELIRTRLSLGAALSGVEYKGILDCLKLTVRHEGVAALYKGIGPTYISGAPYVGLQMTFFDVYRELLVPSGGSSGGDGDGSGGEFVGNIARMMAAGACAGMTAQTITYPGDTIRRRMQSNGIGGAKRIYDNSWQCLVKVATDEGVIGLYRGLGINIIRGIPGAAIQFAAYETLKSLLGAN